MELYQTRPEHSRLLPQKVVEHKKRVYTKNIFRIHKALDKTIQEPFSYRRELLNLSIEELEEIQIELLKKIK
jgi:hypothetical protein